MILIKHYISIRQTFNQKMHILRSHTHTHNVTPSLPQIILSNISLTPAVREHFPRVRPYNQTTEGNQSTRKTKLTKRSRSLSALLFCSFSLPERPKVLCHLLATTKTALFYYQADTDMIVFVFTGHSDWFFFPPCPTPLCCYCFTRWNNTMTPVRLIGRSLLWRE